MKKRDLYLAGVLVSVLFVGGCNRPPHESAPSRVAPDISERAVELREETLYLVTLQAKREEITLDFGRHVWNEVASEELTLLVGEDTFNEYVVGQEIARLSDGYGFVAHGRIASFVVRPVRKNVERGFSWLNSAGKVTKMRQRQYDEMMLQWRFEGRTLIAVPHLDAVHTIGLERPLSEHSSVEYRPFQRYFVAVRVERSMVTPDVFERILEMDAHVVTREVGREAYENSNDAWDEPLNIGSPSSLRGEVVRRWTETDPKFRIAITADGTTFTVPAEE